MEHVSDRGLSEFGPLRVNLTFSEVTRNAAITQESANSCDHAGLTHFCGTYFFHEFLQVLQFRHFLARNLH